MTRDWRAGLTVGLASLAAVLAVLCVVVAAKPTLVPGRSAAEEAARRDTDVTVAATKAVEAFLRVDYRKPDPLIDAMLRLSTGSFKKEYASARTDLEALLQQQRTIATGSVRYVGVGDVDDDTAKVYVAANQKVSNAAIEKEKKAGHDVADQRYYRMQLTLTRVGDRWLLSDIREVP